MSALPKPFSLEEMVLEVERYAELPVGSIRPFFAKEEHWIFVLKTASIIETLLKSAIFLRYRSKNRSGGFGGLPELFSDENQEESALKNHLSRLPLKGDIGALPLGKKLGLIAKTDEDFIEVLSTIRNRYAHSMVNHSKTVMELLSEKKDDAGVAADLAKLSYRTDAPIPFVNPGVGEIEFGLLMFLAGMAGRLAPPKPLPRGLLGDFLAQLPADPIPTISDEDDV